jgi:hypothetical protein
MQTHTASLDRSRMSDVEKPQPRLLFGRHREMTASTPLKCPCVLLAVLHARRLVYRPLSRENPVCHSTMLVEATPIRRRAFGTETVVATGRQRMIRKLVALSSKRVRAAHTGRSIHPLIVAGCRRSLNLLANGYTYTISSRIGRMLWGVGKSDGRTCKCSSRTTARSLNFDSAWSQGTVKPFSVGFLSLY